MPVITDIRTNGISVFSGYEPCYCVCVLFPRKFQPQFCFLHPNVAASFIASPDHSQSCTIHAVRRLVQHSTLPFHVAATFIVSLDDSQSRTRNATHLAQHQLFPSRRDITWAVSSAVTFCGPDNSFCILFPQRLFSLRYFSPQQQRCSLKNFCIRRHCRNKLPNFSSYCC